MKRSRTRLTTVGLSALLLAFSACGESTPEGAATDGEVTLNLAHFPNLTHAPAIYGLREGIYADALGDNVKLNVKTFNAGTEVITALFAGDVDISFIGPNPAINGFQQSTGEAVRIIAGATSGGAALVVKPEITSPDKVEGKTISTPSLGNTQDVALRAWLAERGLTATKEGGGDVQIKPQENAQTLETFRAGQIDGAWVPEPWASRLVLEGGGKVLVDERTLWDDGKYATTLVIVRADFLKEHRDVVQSFLEGHVEVIDRINDDPAKSQRIVNAGLEELTGKPLADDVLESAWHNLTFTYDPLVPTVEQSAAAATNVDLLDNADIEGIAELTILNAVLDEVGKEPVDG